MHYRIKEVVENGKSYFYPQWKKRWFWRRFVWWGGEDGYTPHTVFYNNHNSAIEHIEEDKEKRAIKPEPRNLIPFLCIYPFQGDNHNVVIYAHNWAEAHSYAHRHGLIVKNKISCR